MNTWDKLSMAEKAEIMRLAVAGGVYDLDAIRGGYNEFASGGKIHIAPSKRGTFTAAAKRHGKSVQAFASQVLAHKSNYSPAMVKKANFARNASKWKHGYGGHIYDGTTESTQQMSTYYGNKRVEPLTGEAGNLGGITVYGKKPKYNYLKEWPGKTHPLTAGDAMKGIDAATGPLLHWIQPSQYVGAVRDVTNGKNPLVSMLRGNSGVVSEEYAQEHPWLSTAFNLGTDIAGLSAVSKIGSTVGKGIDRAATAWNQREFNANNAPSGLLSREPLIARGTPEITAENAASIPKAEWSRQFRAAEAAGDREEGERLWDLWFNMKAVNNNTTGKFYRGERGAGVSDYTLGKGTRNPGMSFTAEEKYRAGSYTDYDEIKWDSKLVNLKQQIKGRYNWINSARKNGFLTPEDEKLAFQEIDRLEKELLTVEQKANSFKNPDVRELRIYSTNPEVVDATGSFWNHVWDPVKREWSDTDLLSIRSKDSGHDALIIKNVRDDGYFSGGIPGNNVVVLDTRRAKLAEPFTYANDGSLIDITERADFGRNDIRYSWLAPVIGLGTLGTLYGASNRKQE